uniref:Uncharacterized protein n=1 Tax=Rhizophora mucronata TaxID=61149 RepID=A0A2P2KBA4_RHIMU
MVYASYFVICKQEFFFRLLFVLCMLAYETVVVIEVGLANRMTLECLSTRKQIECKNGITVQSQ